MSINYKRLLTVLIAVLAVITAGGLTIVLLSFAPFLPQEADAKDREAYFQAMSLKLAPKTENAAADVRLEHTSEFEIGFALRNTSGMVLHYAKGYRLYQYFDGEWGALELPYYSSAHIIGIDQYIEPNAIKVYNINWTEWWPRDRYGHSDFQLQPGQYKFVRDFFPDRLDNKSYLTVAIEFEVVSSSALRESFELSPDGNLLMSDAEQEILHRRRQESIDFAVASGGSEVIAPIGNTVVRQRAVTFSFENRSDETYIHGRRFELAHYAGGRWQPMPYLTNSVFMVHTIGYIVQGGETQLETIDFYRTFGLLSPGRYMFIRSHDLLYRQQNISGAAWNREYLLVEFVVDENTPRF